jgi:hypothetical protein
MMCSGENGLVDNGQRWNVPDESGEEKTHPLFPKVSNFELAV